MFRQRPNLPWRPGDREGFPRAASDRDVIEGRVMETRSPRCWLACFVRRSVCYRRGGAAHRASPQHRASTAADSDGASLQGLIRQIAVLSVTGSVSDVPFARIPQCAPNLPSIADAGLIALFNSEHSCAGTATTKRDATIRAVCRQWNELCDRLLESRDHTSLASSRTSYRAGGLP